MQLIVGIGLVGVFLFLSLYLPEVHGYTPLQAGFAFLPFSAGVILTAGLAANLLPKVGPRPLTVPGLLLAATGLLLLSRPNATASLHSGWPTTGFTSTTAAVMTAWPIRPAVAPGLLSRR